MDIKQIEADMYKNVRRRIRDEISATAEINKFRTCINMKGYSQGLVFIAYVEVFNRIIKGGGKTENEIVESLKDNLEKEYADFGERVEYVSEEFIK